MGWLRAQLYLKGLRPIPGSVEEAFLLSAVEKENIVKVKEVIAMAHAAAGSKTTSEMLKQFINELLPANKEAEAHNAELMRMAAEELDKLVITPIRG